MGEMGLARNESSGEGGAWGARFPPWFKTKGKAMPGLHLGFPFTHVDPMHDSWPVQSVNKINVFILILAIRAAAPMPHHLALQSPCNGTLRATLRADLSYFFLVSERFILIHIIQ